MESYIPAIPTRSTPITDIRRYELILHDAEDVVSGKVAHAYLVTCRKYYGLTEEDIEEEMEDLSLDWCLYLNAVFMKGLIKVRTLPWITKVYLYYSPGRLMRNTLELILEQEIPDINIINVIDEVTDAKLMRVLSKTNAVLALPVQYKF